MVKAEEKISTIWPPEGNVAMATPGSVQIVSSVFVYWTFVVRMCTSTIKA